MGALEGGICKPRLSIFHFKILLPYSQSFVPSPGTGPIKILQCKFYATRFFQAFCLVENYYHPIKMVEKLHRVKFTL